MRIVNSIQKRDIWPRSFRAKLLRFAGFDVSPSAVIEAGCDFRPGKIEIGARAYVNRGVLFDAQGGIVLQDRVHVGPRAMFVTATHDVGGPERRAGRSTSHPIFVGEASWNGAGAVVLAGVSVGARSIVAAGAVATNDLEEDTLFAGIPARPKRKLA